MALDDAFALGLAFRHVFGSRSQRSLDSPSIGKALDLYARTRQPHTDRLLRIVHGQLNNNQSKPATAVEENERLISRLRNRTDTEWLSEHDVEAAFGEVVKQLETKSRL